MKKFLFSVVAAAVVLAGCKSIPSASSMEKTSKAVGAAAALVANQTKMSDAQCEAVVSAMKQVRECVPAAGQSFDEAWTPIAKATVQKFVDEGKITKLEGDIVLMAFSVAVKGVDYIFDVRYPKARQYEELTRAAVGGFCDGFLAYFNCGGCSDCTVRSAKDADLVDEEAYEYLKARLAIEKK